MSETETTPRSESKGPQLARSMTAGLLFFYVLGDVLGSGIYALIGLVADEVGGAFWTAFALGVGVALITGLAYAELVTRYPVAAGAALYIKKAFKNEFFTFVVTFCMLAAIVTASGALALTFGGEYFKEFLDWPTLLVAVGFVAVLSFINYWGISETAKTNAIMTFIELAGLLIIIAIGITTVLTGDANYGAVVDFKGDGNVVLAILGGAALSFFAMTGFENAANVAEETQNAARVFPKALLGGMAVAGLLYVLVAISTSLVASYESVAGSEGALLEVVRQGPLAVPTWIFALIALVAVTNTCLVTMVTQSRILYGMAQEGAVPEVFAKVHPKRRTPVGGHPLHVHHGRRHAGRRGGRGGDPGQRLGGVPALHLRPGDHRLPQAAPGQRGAGLVRRADAAAVPRHRGQRRAARLHGHRRPEPAGLLRHPAGDRPGALGGPAPARPAQGLGRRLTTRTT